MMTHSPSSSATLGWISSCCCCCSSSISIPASDAPTSLFLLLIPHQLLLLLLLLIFIHILRLLILRVSAPLGALPMLPQLGGEEPFAGLTALAVVICSAGARGSGTSADGMTGAGTSSTAVACERNWPSSCLTETSQLLQRRLLPLLLCKWKENKNEVN
jgi:hypothetical protein